MLSRSLLSVPVVLASLLSAACAGALPAPAQDPGSGQVQATEQPKRGGVFHLPVTGTNASLNPYIARGSVTTLGDTIYEKLVARDATPGKNWGEDPKLMPWLAERWERSGENTYTFSLRKDVTFHDGKAMTSADVVHTVAYLKETRGLTDSARVRNIKSVEALDPYTIRIVTAEPNPEFLRDDLIQVEIAPRHVVDQGKQYETTAIGTGPFKLKQFDKTAGWTVERNDAFWMKGVPYLDGVAGHYMTDRSTMVAALAAGSIDVMNVADKPQLETIQSIKPDVVFEKFYGGNGYGLFFAMDKPPFDDIRVRRAVNLAIDRQDMIVKGAFGDGIANPPGVAGWITSLAIPQDQLLKMPGYNPATRRQDVAQAKQLLAEAGVRNLEVKLSFGADATNARPIAEVGAAQLKENLGWDVTLRPLDRASLAKAQQEGDYDVIVDNLGQARSEVHQSLHSKGLTNKRGPYDPELDAVVERYIAEFDDAKAGETYRQIQKVLYDKAYIVGAIERAIYTIYQPWVRGFLNNYGGNPIPYWQPPALWLDIDLLPANRKTEKP